MILPRRTAQRRARLIALILAAGVACATALALSPRADAGVTTTANRANLAHPARSPLLSASAASPRALPDQGSLWVVARADGGVVRSSGLTGLTKLGVGRYEARFSQDVHACAYTATIGAPGNGLVFAPGLVFTAGGHLSPEGVYVETKNLGGGLADFPFHLSVNCGISQYLVIGAAGTVVRGPGVPYFVRYGPGRYEAVFGRDTSGCGYTATVGDPGNNLVFNPGLVFTAGGHFSRSRGVYVETKNLSGALSDFPFHLTVSCLADPRSEGRYGAVVDGNGLLVRADGAQSAQRLGPGRYEVSFGSDVHHCAYTATVGDPGNNQVPGPGLVFTASGHLSKNGVYVETKNLGGGLSDFPFHLSVDCRKRPLDQEGVSVLNLNLQGTDSTYGPWRDRYARIASWMGASRTIPDVLLFQETPASKCYITYCDPKDYESLFYLMTAIENATGIRYRVALMDTGPSTEGIFYPLFQGQAVLYNPDRLRNPSTLIDHDPYWSGFARTVQPRDSYPCQNPPESWRWRCSLIDQLWYDTPDDVLTTWGIHWAVAGAAFIRLNLAEAAQDSVTAAVDIWDVHALFIPGTGGTPDLQPIGDAVRAIEQQMPSPGTRLFPPILAGDFNTSEFWMTKHTTEPGQPFEELEIGAYAPESGRHPEDPDGREVIGILVGEPGSFPSRYAARTVRNVFLPEGGPGLCGEAAARWSDHCGQYAEILAAPR
jgi:hypothetical protein